MKKAAAELSLANDFIFGEVMRQPENVKPLLEAVLEKNAGPKAKRASAASPADSSQAKRPPP